MAMSSYMVNSKYVDPKFPPCEEYLQGGYLGEQAADYYGSGAQGADFQPSGLYPRPDFEVLVFIQLQNKFYSSFLLPQRKALSMLS
ncbi:homeobox protein Hox-C4-like protein [Cricetulus griseus]|nr:homeobox protein Hox-C4-like protein [Cricetulus griseus]